MIKYFSMMALTGIILVDTLQIVQAGWFDHWTTTQLTTNYQYMTSIAYGNGEWVATAGYEDGVEYYASKDGQNWTLQSESGGWGTSLKYENGYFTGVGGYGTVSISTNGMDWTYFTLPWVIINNVNGPLGQFGDVACGDGTYVCVGGTNNTGYITTSTNGIDWTFRLSPFLMKGYISSVTYGASTFVAVGNGDGYEYYSNTNSLLFSPPVPLGQEWHRIIIPGGDSVTYCNGLFFIPLLNTNLISVDGMNWDMHSTGLKNSSISNIKYSHGLYIGSANGYLATSTDGTNWHKYAKSFVPGPFATDGNRIATISSVYTGTNIFGGPDGYDGYVNLSDPFVDVSLINESPVNVALSGLIGRQYQILSSDSLGSTANWQTNATLVLSNEEYLWAPATLTTNSSKFYRAALLP